MSHESFREVPVMYLLCEQDQALPVEVQRMMVRRIEEAGVENVVLESCGGSHSPFLSMPETATEVVARAARAAKAG